MPHHGARINLGCPLAWLKGTIFVFHMSHLLDDFAAPQPSRTIMGHPPNANPCPTPGRESDWGATFGMVRRDCFCLSHDCHPRMISAAPQPSRTIHGPSANDQPMPHHGVRIDWGAPLAWLKGLLFVFHMMPYRMISARLRPSLHHHVGHPTDRPAHATPRGANRLGCPSAWLMRLLLSFT
jgi:hypothetical protein